MTPAPVSSPLGLPRRTLRLVEHDPRWPALAGEECSRLRAHLGDAPAIEHLGSTAVPGLAAKPVFGLMIGVASDDARWTLVEPLRDAGYAHGDSDVIPGRLYFRRDDAAGRRTHQASVCVAGGRFRVTHLAFRDAPHEDPELAGADLRRKRELAARFPADRIAHSDPKPDIVAEALRARGIE